MKKLLGALSLRFLLSLSIFLVGAISCAILVLLTYPVVRDDVEQQVALQVEQHLQLLDAALSVSLERGDLLQADQLLSTIVDGQNIHRILVANADGMVISSNNDADEGLFLSELGISAVYEQEQAQHIAKEARLISAMVPLCWRQFGNQARLSCGSLYIEESTAQRLQQEMAIYYRFVFSNAMLFLGGGLAMMLLIYVLVARRVRLLVSTARAFARGKRSVRTQLDGQDEFSAIGRAMDDAFAQLQLQTQVLEQLAGGEELDTILHALAQRLCGSDAAAAYPNLLFVAHASGETLAVRAGCSYQHCALAHNSVVDASPFAAAIDSARLGWTAWPLEQSESELARLIVKNGGDLARCWATVLRSAQGKVLGYWLLEKPDEGELSSGEQRYLNSMAALASFAIERYADQSWHRQASEVFRTSSEGMMITDIDTRIIAVNEAFTRITGYEQAEVTGQKANILRSGRQDKTFYNEMWQQINGGGSWTGELWNKDKAGRIYPSRLTISSVFDQQDNLTSYVGTFRDVSQIKQTEEKLHHLAHHDSLTGLPNRVMLNLRLEHSLELAERTGGALAILFLDLDHFQHINDSLGHQVGDQVLRETARRIESVARRSDTVARLGGDEFCVVMDNLASPDQAGQLADKLIAAIEPLFHIEHMNLSLGVSIGVSVYPRDGGSAVELMKNADAALYRAKQQGRNNYQFYIDDLSSEAIDRVYLQTHLKNVLKKDELRVFYQPQIDMQSGQMLGAEALVRWQHPSMGLVAPDRFIPLAEDTGMIVPIGEWVLKTACEQIVQWRAAGFAIERVSVNLSGVQIRQADLVQRVARTLQESGCEAQWLELEITESVVMDNAEQTIRMLQGLRDLGVQLSIDDFGTGYSSLSYLKRLPVDKLKIDRSFVDNIPQDIDDTVISRTIIALATNLRLGVIAEGIETAAQQQFMVEHGCRIGQGYLFSKPVPAAELLPFLRGEN